MEWIRRVAPVAGYCIGLVFVAIGAVMMLQSGMKLSFTEPNSFYYENQCENDFRYSVALPEEKPAEMTPEEKEECLKNQKEREQKQFKNRNIQDLINGLSLLIVGGIFWGMFRERKEKR